MNLSNEINTFIQNYEYPNFSSISFGEVLYHLVRDNNLKGENEEYCIYCLEDLKEEWLAEDFIRETTSTSTLESMIKREANTINDITRIINERFKIYNKNVLLDECFENRLTITYYKNPDYNEKRYYIEVVLLLEPDNKIKKILNIKKGCTQ